MSNDQNRGTPILNLDDLGGVQVTAARDPNFDPTSNLGTVADTGTKDQWQPDSASVRSATQPDSLDRDSVAATPLHHPASEDVSTPVSEVHTLPDALGSSQTDHFGVNGASSDFDTQEANSFTPFTVIHSEAAADFSAPPTESLTNFDNSLRGHLDSASPHVAVHHTAEPVTDGGGGDPTGQLWIGEGTTSDGVLQSVNSDGTNLTTVYTQTSVPSGDPTYLRDLEINGLDTADNLYFAFGADDAMTVGNISTGTVLTVTQLASLSDDDAMEAMAVDPFNHTIYLSLLGADFANDGGDILKVTYNPLTGALTSPYNPAANGGSGSTTVSASGILIDSTTTSGIYGLANGMWLSPDGSELYYSDDNGNNSGGADYEPNATNGIYKVATSGSNPQPTLLSSQSQFNTDGSDGWIVGVAVDPAKDLIYFTTNDRTGGGSSIDALWYMPMTGGTATKVANVTLDQPTDQDSLTIDEDSQTLYIADNGTDKVVQVTLSVNGESATSVNSSFQTSGSLFYNSVYFDSLPVLTLSTTTTAAVQGGTAVNLLSTAPTVTLESADEIASATIKIANAQTGDELYANGAQTGTVDGLAISWSSSTHTLTLSGIATGATYATALDEITYQDTGTDTTTTGSHPVRTFDWAVNDGITISDASVTDPDQGTTTITINRAPVAVADSYNTSENTELVINSTSGVQANDTNLDGGAMTSTVVATTSDGTLSLASNGSFTYTPNAGFVGDDSFTYKDTENSDSLVSNTVTVTIDVQAAAPTVTSGGTATFDGGGSATTLDAGLTLSSAVNITGATVKIETGYTTGDTLNFTNQNGISGSYNTGNGTLTLSGTTSAANYQTALDSITYSFSPSNGDPTAGGSDTARTIDWQATNSTGASNTGTSTLDTVHVAPTVTASGTVDFTAGGSPVVLDAGLTLADPDSGNDLTGATIKFGAGEFLSGDTLNFTTQNGISGVYSSGTLTLSGTATVAQYQTALESITYTSSSGDPTNGGAEPTRTIDWTVTDGVATSTTGTSTLHVAAAVPSVATGGTVTFDGGGSAVTLDSGATVTNTAGGNMTSATVTIESGYTSGDTLNFTTQNGITGSYNDGTLTLSGAATAANYQTALDSITYSFTPSNGDPTAGGSDTSRTLDWQVTSAVGGNSNTGTSTLNTVHVAPTVTSSGTVSYTAGGPAAVLDAGLTLVDPDSGGNLTGATIALGEGTITGDTLNFTTQNGISGSYSGGVLTLSGTASVADYQAALESVTYTFTPTSGDPTNGGGDTSREIFWQVTDGVASSNMGSSMLDVAADVAPTVSSLSGSAVSGANFASGYTATFTLDVSKDVTIANGTTLSLSDGGTATYVSGSGSTTITFTYSATDAPQALTVTGISAGSIEDSAGKSLSIGGTAISPYSDAVTDSAANVASNFASLNSAVSYISSITLNDGGTPNLDLTAAEILDDQTTIGKIVSSYDLILNDSVTTIGTDFDSLETYAASISAVVFTNGGTPTLDLTQTQVSNDAALLGKVQGPYDLLVSDVTGQAYTSYQNDYNASNTLTEKIDFFSSGSETFYGYVAGLTIAGNNNNDTYYLESAPAVTATGGTGNDLFFFGSGFSSADAINGGGGTNTLELDGTYTGGNALTISTGMMSNIQVLLLAANHSYDITLDAGVVTTGETLTISAGSLGASDALTVDGSALTAGTLVVDAGAGADDLTGGARTNIFNMGANLTASDEINGGTGTTTVNLNGDYSGGVTFTSTTMVDVGTLSLTAGHSYDLVLNAATIGSGHTMTILGDTLGSSDSLTIDGSALTTGTLVVDAGAGLDNLTGGAGTNIFDLGDFLKASDEINGGTGTTVVHLDGNYSSGVAFTATTMTNVSALYLTEGNSYYLVMNAATVADGQTLSVEGGTLRNDSFVFDGSAVTDGGNFIIHGGAGVNTLTGGSGNDTIFCGTGESFITGGGGADLLVAGSGADTFIYNAVSDSTSTTHDTISGFNTGPDKIELLNGLTAPTVINTAVTTGNLSSANFDRALAHDIGAAQLSAHGAVLFTPSTGGYAGDTFLIIDENGVAGYQASQDIVILLTHGINLASLSTANFET